MDDIGADLLTHAGDGVTVVGRLTDADLVALQMRQIMLADPGQALPRPNGSRTSSPASSAPR